MNRCEVRPSIVCDVYTLAANLRDADREEVQSLGGEIKASIRVNYRDAILRKTYFVDGKIAAMTGLCGPMLSDIGYPYLLTTKQVELVPVSFLKLAREGISEMLTHRLRLEGYVAAKYVGACRFLECLGFTLGSQENIGSQNAPFRKFVLVRN